MSVLDIVAAIGVLVGFVSIVITVCAAVILLGHHHRRARGSTVNEPHRKAEQ